MMQDSQIPDEATPGAVPSSVPAAEPALGTAPQAQPLTPHVEQAVVPATPPAAPTTPPVTPTIEPTAAAVSAAAAKAEEKKSGPEVLIVEDDTFLVRAYEVMLSSQGFNVKVVTDGEAAMEHLKKGKLPGVMLLDLMLPKLSGFEVLQEIQADTKLQDVPVVVLSNLGQPDDVARAKELGAKDYFVKADTPLEKVVAVIGKFITNPSAPSNLSEGAAPVAPAGAVPPAVTPAVPPSTPITPAAPSPAQPVVETTSTDTPAESAEPPHIVPNTPPATFATPATPVDEPPATPPQQEPPATPAK